MQKLFIDHFGFSLLELLMVIAIIGILASLALPIYTQQMLRTRRTDGLISLLELDSKMERYYAENHSYAGAKIETIVASTKSKASYYHLSLQNLTATTFTAIATPIGSQLKDDTSCGTLSINELGQKFIAGTGQISQCWKP